MKQPNPIHNSLKEIKAFHYVVKTKFHVKTSIKNYFFNLYFNKLGKYQQERGETFYIIITGDPETESDFYCIPFAAISNVLIEANLQAPQRWLGTIRNHELLIEKSGSRIDVSAYYGTDINAWLRSIILTAGDDLTDITVVKNDDFYEGSIRYISIEIKQRNSAARQACINEHGCKCAICGFSFGKFYGPLADGFIHVHHLNPIANSAREAKIDPKRDLIPLCPNCHSVVHLRREPYSIADIREMIKQAEWPR